MSKFISKFIFSRNFKVFIVIWLINIPPVAISLDCTKATTQIEKLICADENSLTEVNKQSDDLYSQLLKMLPASEGEKLENEQIEWLNQRNLCLKDDTSPTNCLAQMYEERLASLFILYLQALVSHDDKVRLADSIAFPIHVYLEGKRVKINDKQQFVSNYPNIINNKIKSALLKQEPSHFSTHWRGKKIGTGEIWFEGTQIIAINNNGEKMAIGEQDQSLENKHDIDQWLNNCLTTNGYTDVEQVECYHQSSAKWNNELDTAYQTLMNQIDSQGQRSFKDAQNAWFKYRDAEFDLINAAYKSEGTLWTPFQAKLGMNFIKNRALLLQNYLTDRRLGGDTESWQPLHNSVSNRCNVTAQVINTDPEGLNVRSAPQKDIISRIPYNDYEGFTTVHIVDAKQGWLKIDRWEDFHVTVTFDEDAWVYGKFVGTKIEAQPGGVPAYIEPFKTSKMIDKWLGDRIMPIFGCMENWIFVVGESVEGHKVKGWFPVEESK